jgi:hypothetical protein
MLTIHVLTSVGWVGAVVGFLSIAIVGWMSTDRVTSAGLYASLDVLIWWAIVPLAGLSLLSGVLQSLGTPWGLTRHYWVLAKLVLTALASVALLVHTRVVGAAATAAAQAGMDFTGLQQQLVIDSIAALVVLVVITILATVKPSGVTPWSRAEPRRTSRRV